MAKTRKRVPWAGWSKQKPSSKQRTKMYKKCGKKCFLGAAKKPHPSFPICKKNTCKVSRKGVYAAFVRARQWKHNKVAKKAKKMLRSMKKRKQTKRRRRHTRKIRHKKRTSK